MKIALAGAVLASLAIVGALAHVSYLPTHDGPQHLFLGYLENHISNPDRGWANVYEQSPQLTSMGFTVLFSTLEGWLPWRSALTASLAIIALTWAWGFLALCHALHPQRILLGVVGFGCALGWALYMGFFSFVFATGIGFFVLALALGSNVWPPTRKLAIAALLTIQALVHLFPAQLVGFTLVVVVAMRPAPLAHKLRELGALAAMGLPALAITALTMTATSSPLEATHWLTLGGRVQLLAAGFVSGPAWRSWPPVLLAALGIGITLRHRAPDRTALAAVATLLIVTSLFSPFDFNHWQFFSPRLLPLAVMLGVALLPTEKLGATQRVAAAVGTALFALASVAWADTYHRELEQRTADAFSGLDAPITRSGPRLTVVLDPFAGPRAGIDSDHWRDVDVPFVTPLWNMAMVYAVQQGGVPAWSFTSRPRLLPFVMREDARASFPPVHDPIQAHDASILGNPHARAALVTWIGEIGTRFEDLTLYGEAKDGDLLEALGYRAAFRRGGLYMATFAGCPVSLRFSTPRPLEHRLIVQYGWDPSRPPANEYVIPAGTPPEDGGYEIKPRTCFCGSTWYRIAVDLDASNTVSAGDRFCEGAPPNGIVVRQSTAEGVIINCR